MKLLLVILELVSLTGLCKYFNTMHVSVRILCVCVPNGFSVSGRQC